MTNKKTFISSGICLFATLFLFSCQIGLGSSVDTDAPTLSITYPPASAIIKDSFISGGTCDDDVGVSSITVTVSSTDNSDFTAQTYKATIDSTGKSWYLDGLNTQDGTTGEYPFPDGTYEISAIAYDASSHSSGTSSRSFDLDNHAPVLILSSPLSTATSSSVSTYGRSVKLAGDISDDHTVSSVKMYIKQATTSNGVTTLGDLITLPVTDFSSMTGDNPLVIAKYYTDTELDAETYEKKQSEIKKLCNNYESVYGAISDGDTFTDKKYYCGIQLIDNAKTYQTMNDSGTGTGNATTLYYINTDDFYDDLMSDNNNYQLTAVKLRDLLNGTGDDYTAAQIAEIKTILATEGYSASSTDITSTASSRFTLNPNNSPKYSLSGFELGEADDTNHKDGFMYYTPGLPLTLAVSAGTDQSYVKPSTVEITLYKVTSYDEDLDDVDSSNIQTILAKGDWNEESAASKTYEFSLDSTGYTLAANGTYVVGVTGEDRNGNDLVAVSDTGYGFKVHSNHTVPVITFNTNEDSVVSGDSLSANGIAITGTVQLDSVDLADTDGLIMSGLTVINTSTNADVTSSVGYTSSVEYVRNQKYSNGAIVTGQSDNYYTFTVTLTDKNSSIVPSGQSKYKYKVSVCVTDAESGSTTKTLPFYVDNKAPTLTLSSVSPVATTTNSVSYVNGLITISGNAGDNNELSDVTYTLKDASGSAISFYPYSSGALSSTAVSSVSLGSTESISIVVDTTQSAIAEDAALTISVTATDSVNNTTTVTKTVTVDQDTDTPVVTLTNASSSINSIAGIATAVKNSADTTNIFAAGSKLTASITDDDGISAVYVYKKLTGTSSYDSTALFSKTGISATNTMTLYTLSCTLPTVEGAYDLYVKVVDTQGASSYGTLSTSLFTIAIDSDAPVFSSVTPSETNYYSTQSGHGLTVAGTVTDGSQSFTLVADSGNGTSAGYASAATISGTNGSGTTKSISDSITLPSADGKYTITYTATDVYGQSSTKSITYYVDNTKPVFCSTNATYPDYISGAAYNSSTWYHATSLSVSGCWTEALSGVATVYYQVVAAGDSATAMTVSNYSTTSTGSFTTTDHGTVESFNVTLGGFVASNTANYLRMVAVDNAGNVSELLARSINVDTATPTISSDNTTTLSNASAAVTLSGTSDYVADSASGIASGSVIINGYTVASGTTYASSTTQYGSSLTLGGSSGDTNRTWTLVIGTALLEKCSGTVGITMTATDTAGNSSTGSAGTLQIDTTAPTVTFTSPTASATVNKTVKVTGTASDGKELKYATLWIKKTTESSYTQLVYDSTDTKNANVTLDSNSYLIVADDNSWAYYLDTTKWNNSTTDGVSYTLKVVGVDSAGNSTETSSAHPSATRAVTVNQNSDRPVIKVTSITTNGATLMYGNDASISGSVSDDDNDGSTVVKTFIASGVQITSASGATGTTDFDSATGEWEYTPADTADGTKTVYFYVVDNEGAIFYCGNTTTTPLFEPYVKSTSSASATYTTGITYTSDSQSPTISSVKAYYGDDNNANDTKDKSIDTSLILGGTSSRYVKFTVVASDASGIASVAVSATDGTNTFSDSTTSYSSSFTTSVIDLSTWTTGSVTVTTKVIDGSGLYSNNTSTFTLDNSGPAITVSSPLSTDEVTADVTVKGSSADSGSSGTSSAVWLVPTKTQLATYTTDELLASANIWNTIDSGSTATSWVVTLASATICAYDDTTTYATTIEDATAAVPIYLVPFYVCVKDSVGNYTILKHTVRHNPDADIPSASLSYPTSDDYDTGMSYVTLGGTIRVSGMATDNVSVSSVYLQIDMDPTIGGSNDFDSDDSSAVTSLRNSSNVSYYTVADADSAGIETGASSDWWGIKVTNTSSWSITLNANSEFDAATSGELHYIRIRACAVDNNNRVGAWSSPVFIAIDNNAPKIGSSLQKLYQYSSFSSSSPTANISASQDYVSGVYLKGAWYLAVSLEDEGGIASYAVKKGSSTLTSGTEYTVASVTSGGITNYNVYIPIDTSSSTLSYTISATDYATSSTTAHTSTKTFALSLDNTAPTIETLAGNDDSLLVTSDVPVIQNSDYFYTLSGSLTEEDSGFQRLVFYFLRNTQTDGTANRVYDPMIAYSSTYDSSSAYATTNSLSHSRTNVSDLTELTVAQGTSSYSMYGKQYTGGTCTGSTYTHSDISDNSHIRVGGLIYIGGVYRLITSISGDVVTFDSAATTSDTTATCPYVQVVDNTSTEKTALNNTTHRYTLTTDDGDGMPESVGNATTTYTWSATLYTDDLPDGPITLVCLAFDEAGNVSGSSIVTKIQNNAPRLAKLYLGTDLSGDGTYTDDEFNVYTFNSSGKNANYAESVTFATAGTTYADYGTQFTVKNGLAVMPEITGGNGTVKMAYLYSAGAATTAQTKSGTNVVFVSPESGTTTVPADFSGDVATNSYTNVADALNAYVLTNYNITNEASGTTLTTSDNASTRAMSFTFWDSTDGYTCGTDSYECFAGITDFCVNIVDGTIPAATITPYTTDTVADNVVTESSTSQGHIDLTNKVNSSYPAVSGKIKISGTASDDTRLKLINVTFADLSVTKYSTYSTSLVSQSASVAQYYAIYVPGKGWIVSTPSVGAAAELDTDGWTFAVSKNILTQSMHSGDWELDIDTAKLTGVAGKAKAITVSVTDAAGNTNATTITSASQTATGALTPKYTVDVVPYITKLVRSSGNSLRSRLGKLQVLATDTIAVTGFNLPSTSSTSTIDTSNLIFVDTTANAAAVDTATGTGYTYTVTTSGTAGTFSTPSASGYVRIITNGVSSLNNCDENADYNYESTGYSTKSGGTDDDTSTGFYYNDRYISVWQTATTFASSAQAISPTIDADSTGSVRGSWSSDAAMYYEEVLTEQSRLSPLGTTSWKDSPDDTDMTIVNDSPFYVILDNWQGSGTEWSSNGLMIARNGYKFTTSTASTSSVSKAALEVQGNATAESPDSSDGMDEMMYQFQNPKIAAVYSDSTYHVYASYYDAYAHCLKYGKFTYSGTSKDPTIIMRTGTDNAKNGYCVVDGYDTTVSAFSDYEVEVGEQSDIVIDTVKATADSSSITPVIAYCDSTNGTLKIARGKSTAPTTTGAVITSAGTTPSATRGWYYTTIDKTASDITLGGYVSMAIDAGGNLHIATQDTTNGDLYYLYLTYSGNADNGYTLVSCTKVDSENSVGKWTDIKLTSSSGTSSVYGLECYPVISYLDATNVNSKKAVKVAFVNSATSATAGVWDHMTAPLTYSGYDEKTSLVLSAYDGTSVKSRLGIGYKSASFATAFMRSE